MERALQKHNKTAPPSLSHLYQGPRNDSDHVVQKPAAADPDNQVGALFLHLQAIDGPHRAFRLRTRLAEAFEIMLQWAF